MTSISHVFIIYNPNSTGDAKKNATTFARDLRKAPGFSAPIKLVETKYAGHAEELAVSFATKYSDSLIISSSGDGGYHDVVNGVLSSKDSQASVGLLPSGNANDHYTAQHSGDTVQRITANDFKKFDVLKLRLRDAQSTRVRYAHSYAGIGLTSRVGKELNKTELNRFNEVWLVLKHLWHHTSVKVAINDRPLRYESLVVSNIDRMSKVLSLSDNSSIKDGKFEINSVRQSNIFGLLSHLLRASTLGLNEHSQVSRFEFTCLQPLQIQIDGEIYECKKNTVIDITSEKQKLRTII
jgi:diacylglycerol kinase (ATP)